MKKTVASMLVVCASLVSVVSCKKDTKMTGDNNGLNSQNKKQEVLASIQTLEDQVNSKKGGPKVLVRWGAILAYGGADLAGGIRGAKWGAIGGPGYAGAGALLGAVIGSTLMYVERNYDIKAPDPDNEQDGTDTYDNDFEKLGYLHNQGVANTVNDPNFTLPSTALRYLDDYYDFTIAMVADKFDMDATSLKRQFPKNELLDLAKDACAAAKEGDYTDYIAECNLSQNAEDIFNDFIADIHNPNITDRNTYFEFTQLYIQLVNEEPAISTEDRNSLLYAFNIFRYSFSFWSNNLP